MDVSFSPGPSQTMAFAAGELERYLRRMLSGAPLPPIRLSLEGSGEEERERFTADLTPQGGVVTGSNSRSVLLGVYQLLRALGCRFLGPGREVVPAIRPEQLCAHLAVTPSYRHRGVCIEGANSRENVLNFIDWLPKVGFNSFFLQFTVPYTFLARWYHHEGSSFLSPESYTMDDAARDAALFEAALKKRGLLLHKAGHGWTGRVLGYDTAAWQSETSPLSPALRPRAAMLNGRRELFRGISADTNLCFHCGDAVDAFARLVTDYAAANPQVDYLHIWLADEYNNVCECGGCRATTPSDQYVDLLNEIDRRLTARGLNTRLVFLLYQELLWPPVRERLKNPSRFVLMFAPISRTFERSYDLSPGNGDIPPYVRNRITLPSSLPENLAFLRGWQKIFSGDSFVYDYPLGRAHYGDFGYLHIARVISEDVKSLHRLGLDGYISCQELRAALPNDLPNYVMGHTLLDDRSQVDDLTGEYFAAAYGSGAPAVRSYLEELSRLSSCDYLNGKGPRIDPEMAARLEDTARRCRDFAPVILTHRRGEHWETPYWAALEYHSRYIDCLSRAMAHLARGETEAANRGWETLRDLISQNEPAFQPWLDVYRILEVTGKYTGFSAGRK